MENLFSPPGYGKRSGIESYSYSGASRYSYSNGSMMTEPIFDHDRLDVYRLSIDYVASSFKIAGALNGLHRHARDQWLRAAQSIPLNIAEGDGKRSLKDRNRFLDIARGSALECAAIQDVLAATDGIDDSLHHDLKQMLKRVVAMLTRLIARSDVVSASSREYNAADEYEYRDAEHEHEYEYEYEHEYEHEHEHEHEYEYEEDKEPESGKGHRLR